MNHKRTEKELGELLITIITFSGIIMVLVGILLKDRNIIGELGLTILLSIGCSVLASGLVLFAQSRYQDASHCLDQWLRTWRVHDLFETKSEMNNSSANKALRNCTNSIDIIAEGLSGYRLVKGEELKRKIRDGIKVRIISCDSWEMLKQHAKDEAMGGSCTSTEKSIEDVKSLYNWVKEIKAENGDIQIKFHSTYPGFSYLRIDSMVYFSPNLWRKTSQYSFAIGFEDAGKGGKYFTDYFDDLWNDSSFVHEDFRCQ